MADPSGFGQRLGEAAAKGSQSISQGIQQRYLQEALALQKKADQKWEETRDLYKIYTQQDMDPGLAQQVSQPGVQEAMQKGVPPRMGGEQIRSGGQQVNLQGPGMEPGAASDMISRYEEWKGQRGQKQEQESKLTKAKIGYYGRRGSGGTRLDAILNDDKAKFFFDAMGVNFPKHKKWTIREIDELSQSLGKNVDQKLKAVGFFRDNLTGELVEGGVEKGKELVKGVKPKIGEPVKPVPEIPKAEMPKRPPAKEQFTEADFNDDLRKAGEAVRGEVLDVDEAIKRLKSRYPNRPVTPDMLLIPMGGGIQTPQQPSQRQRMGGRGF